MLLVWYGFGPRGVQIPARALCNALWYENPGYAEVKRMSGAISAVDDKSWWPLFRVSYNFLVGILVLGLPRAGNKRSCRQSVKLLLFFYIWSWEELIPYVSDILIGIGTKRTWRKRFYVWNWKWFRRSSRTQSKNRFLSYTVQQGTNHRG